MKRLDPNNAERTLRKADQIVALLASLNTGTVFGGLSTQVDVLLHEYKALRGRDLLPDWWPLQVKRDGYGLLHRYTVTVDGEEYGFSRRHDASAFFARLEAFTEKVALFKDHGRRRRRG